MVEKSGGGSQLTLLVTLFEGREMRRGNVACEAGSFSAQHSKKWVEFASTTKHNNSKARGEGGGGGNCESVSSRRAMRSRSEHAHDKGQPLTSNRNRHPFGLDTALKGRRGARGARRLRRTHGAVWECGPSITNPETLSFCGRRMHLRTPRLVFESCHTCTVFFSNLLQSLLIAPPVLAQAAPAFSCGTSKPSPRGFEMTPAKS